MPLVVVGVLLVVGCALGFADASLSLASHEDVLVVAQPLAAGQVLTSSVKGPDTRCPEILGHRAAVTRRTWAPGRDVPAAWGCAAERRQLILARWRKRSSGSDVVLVDDAAEDVTAPGRAVADRRHGPWDRLGKIE